MKYLKIALTKYNGVAFNYDSTIKDKLINAYGKAVSYANVASLNPTSWNGRSYGYEGRRLTNFSWNGKSCNYEYDEQSHRIRKVVNGIIGITIGTTTLSVSWTTLMGIASLGTAMAGIAKYICDSYAYNISMSVEGIFLSAAEGSFEGLVSFGCGALAGATGFFKYQDKSIFNPHKTLETSLRSILFSLPSMVLRNGLKKLFE